MIKHTELPPLNPSHLFILLSMSLIIALSGCVTAPTGPSVKVMRGAGLSLEQFHHDEAICQQQVLTQVSGISQSSAMNADVKNKLLETSASFPSFMQRFYDASYSDCMATKGHKTCQVNLWETCFQ